MKYVIAALGLIAGLPQAALADETSNTEQLKQMLDELAADKPSDEVYQAFLEKWLASSVGETGIWVDYRKTEFEDDRSRSGKSADSYSRVIGIDHRLTPRVTVGFALMNLDTDTSTTPSNDAFEGYSTIDDDSRGFAFMGQYTLKSWLAMSGSVTVLETETDITDYSTAAPPSTKSTDGDSVTLDLGANVFESWRQGGWASPISMAIRTGMTMSSGADTIARPTSPALSRWIPGFTTGSPQGFHLTLQ